METGFVIGVYRLLQIEITIDIILLKKQEFFHDVEKFLRCRVQGVTLFPLFNLQKGY
jgi:hypothetical protein